MLIITRRFLFVSMDPHGNQNETVETFQISKQEYQSIGVARLLSDFPMELIIEDGDSVLRFSRLDNTSNFWEVPEDGSEPEYCTFQVRYKLQTD
jgi:hypothetical protein